MRRRMTALAVAMLLLAVAGGCNAIAQNVSTTRIGSEPYTIGSGKETKETRALAPFHGVSVENGIAVSVGSGPSPSAAVTIDDNLVPMIKTTVDGGVLRITVEGSLETHLRPRVVVTTPDAIDTLAAGNGSTVDMETVKAATLTALVANGSTLRAAGTATALALTVTSGSTGDLRNLTAETATVNVSAGSTGHVRATKSVTGSCVGGSTAIVHGNPAARSISNDTSSTVKSE